MASAFALGVLFVMAMAAPSWAASTPCNGTILGGEIKGNVTVEKECRLGGVTVRGNVTVDPGARLEMGGTVMGNVIVGVGGTFSAVGTVEGNLTVDRGGRFFAGECSPAHCPLLIKGDLRGNEAEVIRSESETTVGGNLALTGTVEGSFESGQVILSRGRVNGNVEIDNGLPSAFVAKETVGGSVRILNNQSRSVAVGEGGLGPIALEIVASTVGGNVEVRHNALGSAIFNVIAVRNTSVTNNLVVNNNIETGTSELASAPGENDIFLTSNHVGGSAELLNNTSKTTSGVVSPGRTDVSANGVTNNLICTGNEPPPADEEGPNTAKQKLGQCALL
jgi:cytoskeletal protein CcmA (bactofilin family)